MEWPTKHGADKETGVVIELVVRAKACGNRTDSQDNDSCPLFDSQAKRRVGSDLRHR